MDIKWIAYLFASLFSGALLASDPALFHALDADNDGYLTKDDVSDDSVISNAWDELDANDDGRLDRAEFAKLETLNRGSERTDGATAD